MHQPSSTSEDTSERLPGALENVDNSSTAEGSGKSGVPPAPVSERHTTVGSTSKTAFEGESGVLGSPLSSLHPDAACERAEVEPSSTTDRTTAEEPTSSREVAAWGHGPTIAVSSDPETATRDDQVRDREVISHGGVPVHPETLPKEDVRIMAPNVGASTSVQTVSPRPSVPERHAGPHPHEVGAGSSSGPSKVERDAIGCSDENYEKTSVGDLCCILVILPAAAFTIVYLLSLVKGRSRTDSSPDPSTLTELMQVCPGSPRARQFSDCHDVMTSVLEASNPNVAPCSDFYGHVCGWWNRWNNNRSSQAEELVRTFNNHVITALLNAARLALTTPEGPRTLPQQMAVFYLSCFNTALGSGRGGGSVVDVLDALSTDVTTWLSVASFGSLLELVVSTSLKTGLPSFVAVSFQNKSYEVVLGETLTSTFAQYQGVENYVSGYVLSFQGVWGPGKNASAAILELDDELENIRQEPGPRPWSNYSSRNQMGLLLPGLDWARALDRGLPEWLRNGSERSHVRVHGAGHIVRLVDRLRAEPLTSAGLYSLVVLLSQIMKYKAPMKQSFNTFSSTDRFLWCLELTATYFDAIYPQWVRDNFEDEGDVTKLREIFGYIVSTVTRSNRVNMGVVVSTYRLVKARLVILGDEDSGNMSTAMLPVTLGSLFLPNMARLIASRVGRVNEALLQASILQLRGHLGFHGTDFVVGTVFVHRTSLYSPFASQDTRYATLVVRILRSIFESEAAYDPSWAASYVNRCFAASVVSAIGRLPSSAEQSDGHIGAAVKPFMGHRWAVQLALRMDPTKASSENRSFERLFFRLACFERCGDARGRDEWNDFANFAPEFVSAYHCSRERRGLCDECSAIDRCETHLPHFS